MSSHWLCFRLGATLASMSTRPGNHRRSSDRWPAGSAIRGLIGAALGVPRTDADGHQALETGYAIGLARRHLGEPLTDFHTVQSVPRSVVRGAPTRRRALAHAGPDAKADRLYTIVTEREYITDAEFDVAIQPVEPAPAWPLERLRDALAAPAHVLYLGRKSCPLDRPTGPLLLDADHVADAFADYAAHRAALEPARAGRGARTGELLLDPRLVPDPAIGIGPGTREMRFDGVADRPNRAFAPRASVRVDLVDEESMF